MPYYHLYIEWKDWKTSLLTSNTKEDLSIKQLSQFIDPIKDRSPVFFNGWRIDPNNIWHLEIWETTEREKDKSESSWAWIYSCGRNVTNDFLASLPQKSALHKTMGDKTTPASLRKKEIQYPLSKNVFVVHGRNLKPALELENLLKGFGLNPIILYKQPDQGRTIIEKLEDHSADVGYVFVILTPDDGAFNLEQLVETMEKIEATRLDRKHKDDKFLSEFGRLTQKVARQNVILELGYFMGLLGRNRICCLYAGDVALPSDLHGIVYKKFKESVNEVRDKIVKELKAAGYEIKA